MPKEPSPLDALRKELSNRLSEEGESLQRIRVSTDIVGNPYIKLPEEEFPQRKSMPLNSPVVRDWLILQAEIFEFLISPQQIKLILAWLAALATKHKHDNGPEIDLQQLAQDNPLLVCVLEYLHGEKEAWAEQTPTSLFVALSAIMDGGKLARRAANPFPAGPHMLTRSLVGQREVLQMCGFDFAIRHSGKNLIQFFKYSPEQTKTDVLRMSSNPEPLAIQGKPPVPNKENPAA